MNACIPSLRGGDGGPYFSAGRVIFFRSGPSSMALLRVCNGVPEPAVTALQIADLLNRSTPQRRKTP